MKRSFGKKRLCWVALVLLSVASFAVTELQAQVTQITGAGAGKGADAYRGIAAMAEAVNRNSKTIQMTNRECGGFVEGTRLVATNRVQIAITNGPFVDFWQRSLSPFDRDTGPRDSLRGVGPRGDSMFQIAVLKDSDINTFMDLKGRRVSLGPKGSNSYWMIEFALKAAGILDTIRVDSLNWNDAATYMIDHKLDAFGIPNPIPAPAILQASFSAPIRILSIPETVIKAFIDYSPGYFKESYDGSSYKGMEKQKFMTVAYMSMLVSNKNVSDDIVYEVTRHSYDPKNYDLMVNISVGWRDGLEQAKDRKFLEIMKLTGMKLHPGAARYWKEKGFKVD